jgi:asparagine synthase (glutamine-hydrolysing)
VCGIAGIYQKHFSPVDERLIKAMLQSIAHRGPDDEGIYVRQNIGIGHRRLSIIDTSQAGHQPMRYKHFVITYNGEIYNYLEIREKLLDRGHTFVTRTDTEVILHAYEEWGKDCLHHFTGMWGFAMLDEVNNLLFCSRDRFGIKPFYYHEDDEVFAFASEIKALLFSFASAHVNYERLIDYLVVGITDHTEDTFFQDVRQLLPGHVMIINLGSGKVDIEKYFDLASYRKVASSVDDYAMRLRDSVRIHLRSDVPVGTCLSGGIDSSVVAALAASFNRENGNDHFSAVTARSESPHNDETPFARQVVEHCKLDWHIANPLYDDFVKRIEECLRFQEEPVGGPSVFMQYWVMKTAKDAGLKVMLDGQGGDETLLGYERYYISYFWHLFKRGHWIRLIREYLLAVRHSKMSFFRLTASTGYFSIFTLRKLVLKWRVHFLKKEYMSYPDRILRKITKDVFDLNKLQISEIRIQQLPQLLKYEDRNSMAYSIEARVPYVELGCIQAALSLYPEEKIRKGYTKYPLRKIAEKILPYTIAWRREKIGFEAPAQLWLDQYQSIMQNEIQHSRILKRICKFLPELKKLKLEIRWRLYNIAIWERLYHVQP